MADLPKGTENLDSNDTVDGWCFISQAECVDSVDTLSELFDADSVASNISNLIEDFDEPDEGNSLALFNQQVREECDRAVIELKRKFVASPPRTVEELSPRLQAVYISPKRQSKRRLFADSGIEDETTNSNVQVDVTENNVAGKNDCANEEYVILHSSNRRATLYAKFKEKFNVSFNELTRVFKSNKTCTHNWIVVVFAVADELVEASKIILQQHCEYIQIIPADFTAMYLLEFKSAKSRETVCNLFMSFLNISDLQILSEPPKNRSTVAALFFYKKNIANIGFKYGILPEWVTALTVIEHQAASAETFELSQMIQWCYDHNYVDEATIAYNYALYAEQNSNAAAFLKSNQQLKYVKDACQMVRMYKRQEQRNMSMAAWINKCCGDITAGDEWRTIVRFLTFQHINILSFLIALKQFFKNIPKKSCIVIYGPSDTGKSFFCFKLVKFLQGAIVSYMNKNSHFWITPLIESKIGFLDDATPACWNFLDSNMRNAFDGNYVSVDVKHRALQQVKLPPMFITTNKDVTKDDGLKYLVSRLVCFEFPNKMPLDGKGNPVYNITTESWAMFFRKFASHLELEDEDTDGDPGNSDSSFCCTARHSVDTY
ncbi:E1 [Gammapapillomavirus sp.]|nr:E1 [Gammapapillomavirus sp.]